ncbi:MAG TPA: molybdopterin-dependent oxidoreductase [Nocardioides sp.]|nr:molybdopterin-dependent oxidoreductase [Nocardioides sp.]
MAEVRTTTCPLCEATCGLTVTVEGPTIKVRGDELDPLSRGYLCPKGAVLGDLHADPDRLRTPMVRRDGELVEASWEEAFEEIDRRLTPIIEEHGREAVAVYFGNPSAHQLASMLYLRPLVQALATPNVYSAGTVDQIPKMFVTGYMYGDVATIPVPDLDRTDHLVLIGANPLVSNGSMMTAPDLPKRLAAIRERGKVVVIDPCRTRTAAAATEHVPVRPGSDALLLAAMVHTVLTEDLADLAHLAGLVAGLEELPGLVEKMTPERVAAHTGVPAEEIRRLARELAAADRAAIYGRIGTTAQAFGTLSSWLIEVLAILTGNVDRPGGLMFPKAAAGQPNTRPGPRKPFRHGRWRSRVSGRPEVMGELPVAVLPEEILTPGPGQVRAVLTLSGNPCLSSPNTARMDEAFASLDFMVSVDVYLNETTRHADVILPGPSPLERPHYDVLLYQYAIRNVARYSAPLVESPVPGEWQTMLRLGSIAAGLGPRADLDLLDHQLADGLAGLNGVEADHTLRGPERLLDVLLKAGPYDLDLATLRAAPHGVDLGELEPRLPGVLATASGKVELAPGPVVADLGRLLAELDQEPDGGLVLIGRRHLRSNNSWMHNLGALNRGSNDCTAQVHPADAARLGLVDGDLAELTTRAGSIEAVVEVTPAIAEGVVSVPHGWGHAADGARLGVAAARPGVNCNVLTDELLLDEPTGTAAVNGVPVTLRAVAAR